MNKRSRRHTGCNIRCGGDCYDEVDPKTGGLVFVRHKCPPKHAMADKIVALMCACDEVKSILNRRAWAKVLTVDDVANLRAAIDQLLKAGGRDAS